MNGSLSCWWPTACIRKSEKKTLLRYKKSIEVQSGVAASRMAFNFTPWHRHRDFPLFLTRDYEWFIVTNNFLSGWWTCCTLNATPVLRKSKWVLMRKIMKLTFKPLNLSSILDTQVVLFHDGKRKIMCDKIIEGLVTIPRRKVENCG